MRLIKQFLLTAAKLISVFVLFFLLPVGCQVVNDYSDGQSRLSWGQMRRDSSSQAPDAATTPEAVIQVYSARAARWRGSFGVHTWVATKRQNAGSYTRFEVIGYALRWGGNTVRVRSGQPDSYWYGSKPYLLRELRGGADVEALIDRLHRAADDYPHHDQYNVWPGPNSNTFVAYLARQVPELALELPATAIGKDFLLGGAVVARAPSGSGWQLSLRGLLGILIGVEEGVEINLLGLSAGLDVSPLAIKLPGIGRIGFSDFQRATL